MDQIRPWVGFNLFVLLMLAVDPGVFHHKAHEVSVKEGAGAYLIKQFRWNIYVFGGFSSSEP